MHNNIYGVILRTFNYTNLLNIIIYTRDVYLHIYIHFITINVCGIYAAFWKYDLSKILQYRVKIKEKDENTYSFLENVHTSYPPAQSYRELLAEKIYLYPEQAYEKTTNSPQPSTTHSKMRRWFRQLKRTRVAYTT